MLTKEYMAEFIGTLLLVLLGCGSAVLGGNNIIGVSLGFGSALLLLVYTIGPVSGCHVNPAVTLCLASSEKFSMQKTLGYIISQCLGGVVGGYLLWYIASGHSGFVLDSSFALNGFGEHSPSGYNMMSCLITEVVMTSILLLVVLKCVKKQAQNLGIILGVTLMVLHLVSIPVTNTSVNFARSLGVAAVHGGFALEQLWLFAVANIAAVFVAKTVHCATNKD